MKVLIVSVLAIFQTLYASSLREHGKDGRIAVKNVVENGLKGFVQTMNIAGGSTFPSNPTYVIYKTYADASCTTVTGARSNLLNTCMANGQTSIKYTCCKSCTFFLKIFLLIVISNSGKCSSPNHLLGRLLYQCERDSQSTHRLCQRRQWLHNISSSY
jgi:hypothetical protein